MSGRKWDYTIERRKGLERTVVGKDGQIHHPPALKKGKHGHFTASQEGEYRSAIETAKTENSRVRELRPINGANQPVFRIGPLEYDSFGLLPADGFGRLSSEDF